MSIPAHFTPAERLLTVAELAEYLHVSERIIWRLKAQGAVPWIRVGGSVRFRKESVDAALADMETKRIPEPLRE